MFRFPNSGLTETEAGSEVQIETLPADQQEPARKEWEKVLFSTLLLGVLIKHLGLPQGAR